jgi:hypothetical protein
VRQARVLVVFGVISAAVFWFSSSPPDGWLFAVLVVVAALALGVGATITRTRIEGRWIKSWWTKWRSHV